ncbi:GTP 3',8-cyclase MoaA [Pontibacter silvestris]|uniref:GTP 3',8-cyclase MoaA n=1 Tax=Pontibacter silvestris TaxID=2305183 RepID=A0ABW4X1H7_9BACT|nr:GTP 3',8-cyclase MoaA [Pontibacter silvestris]MCC9137477.1 radical SAM protein [Pontibacter silvestris]
MMNLGDVYGRTFKTLRVSLLSTCNLGCVYCTVGDATINVDKKAQTPAAHFLKSIAQLHEQLNLETVRFTGGEPLLYHDLITVVEGVREIGIPHIKITTNAYLLDRMAPLLKEAGLQSVNVSLDAVDEEAFFKMSKRRHVDRVLKGIDTALKCGLEVKLNSVVLKGLNHEQILPLLDYAFDRNIPIRFLEVMAMGHLHNQADQYLFTQEDILLTIASKYDFMRLPRKVSATANYWQTDEGKVFGIVANESEPFCHDCNRLRLDAQGNIYGCLSSNFPVSINNIETEEELEQKLKQAMKQKQKVKFTGSELSMLHIGG